MGEWEPEEMTIDPNTDGIYRTDVPLKRAGGQFQIMVNQDWRQLIYPVNEFATADTANPVTGPDDQGFGHTWSLHGKAGDVFRIEFQRTYEGGDAKLKVSWQKTGTEELPAEKSIMPYYIVGSWDRWSKRHQMTLYKDVWEFSVEIGPKVKESFQILEDGDWNRCIFPVYQDATSGTPVFKKGRWNGGLYWTIGADDDDKAYYGSHFKVRLYFASGFPTYVD